MYTNEKPYTLPAYAQRPLLSRARLLYAAALALGTLGGAAVGLFETQSRDETLARATVPDVSASSALLAQEAGQATAQTAPSQAQP